ncbi:MAG: fatty acyl-AMP ligase [Acidobacteria bacterium]|nr:fatty acyl-AMP ligase [Acidobacteriota bacterium]
MQARTFADLVRARADERGDARAFVFLPDGEREDAASFGAMDARARQIAAALHGRRARDERVLLLCPPGLDFVAALFGCFYAGAIAVPVPVPRAPRHVDRLHGIARDASPRYALCVTSVLDRYRAALEAAMPEVTWLPVGTLDADGAAWVPPSLASDGVALLQYTSGSTSLPKGVMVTHASLLANLQMMEQFMHLPAASPHVSWLPPFHDMGLVAGALRGVYTGNLSVLMPPEAFLMKPVRWLRAISRYRAAVSGGPTFAYDLCAERVTTEQMSDLDLSHWLRAYVGAEPVRARTLERFATCFAPVGFSRQALRPCYGLAEATLMAAGCRHDAAVTTRAFDADALAHGCVRIAAGDAPARTLVGCGTPYGDGRIAIVDPATAQPCGPDRVGEIWVAGPHVAAGYWSRPRESGDTFRACAAGDAGGHFLRTGDLGFVHDGELFVAGRVKDIIIVSGRNHHPADIEHTVEACDPAIRTHGCAAFPVDVDDVERVVIVLEVARSAGRAGTAALEAVVRRRVAEHHDVQPHLVLPIRPGTLPRTSSGKIQRHVCRDQFLSRTLQTWTTD